jgi:lipopolysaccharide export system protein LptA
MKRALLLLISLICALSYCFSQVKGGPPVSGESKPVEILDAKVLRTAKIDSVREVQTGSGSVRAMQGTTLFECDSFYYDRSTKAFEAFGNVHINDNDSINIYSNYLLYHVDTRIANLRKNVRLTDGKSTLTTQQLDYDLNQKIGNYYNGGKVVNDKSVLTSTEATYFADAKNVLFKKHVVLIDPQYKLRADSLLYNSETQLTTFITKTYIEDSARKVVTSSGYYDLKNKKASFGKRPIINDGASQVIADNIDTDDSTGVSILTGNVSYKDTAQGYAMRGDFMHVNNKEGSLLATKNAVLIIKQDKDSLFVTGDTLFSAKLSSLMNAANSAADSIMTSDTALKNNAAASPYNTPADSASRKISAAGDSIVARDSTFNYKNVSATAPSATRKGADVKSQTAESVANVPSPKSKPNAPSDKRKSNIASVKPSKDIAKEKDTGMLSGVTVVDTKTTKSGAGNDSADRYFQVYHNVRIFSDSLQAVADSLFYSGKDSIFRLFRNPVMWATNSQVSGDTIFIYTKNKKADRIHVFENAITVNKSGTNMYNQLKGNRMNGYFREGVIDYMRAKGNAESIYYAKDKEDYLVGINRVAGDIIDLRFLNKELNKVVVMNEVKGTMYPVTQMPESEKRLRNFKWQEDRRPKTKFELFEPPKALPVTAKPAAITTSNL